MLVEIAIYPWHGVFTDKMMKIPYGPTIYPDVLKFTEQVD